MTSKPRKTFKLAVFGAVVLGMQGYNAAAQTYHNSSKLPDIILNAYTHHPQLKSLQAGNFGARESIIQARAAARPKLAYQAVSLRHAGMPSYEPVLNSIKTVSPEN